MYMNVLSQMMDRAASVRSFYYHPRYKNMKLMHICFVDDLMGFSDGKLSSLQSILVVFKEFVEISWLQLSLEKSTIFMAGVKSEARAVILSQFPFDSEILPVRYMGLLLLTKRMTLSDCLPLIEKIRSRIISWKNRFLLMLGGCN